MLLETMSPMEITRAILKEVEIYNQKALHRLSKDYERERKKKKIPKNAQYAVMYEITTYNKVKIIYLFSKPPADEVFKGNPCICILSYQYTRLGLRVYKIIPGGGLSVFNPHVFKRYNERMQLNIEDQMDRVEHFFIHNGFFRSQVFKKEDGIYTVTRCRDGLLLGKIENEGYWLVHRTFISFNETRKDQDQLSQELVDSLQDQIEQLLNHEDFDRDKYEYMADIVKGITKK